MISNLHRVFLTIALINAGEGTVSTIFPPFLDAGGYSVSDIGFVVSVFAVLSLVSRLPSGLAYRPHRARKMTYASLGVFAISLPLYSLATDASSLVALRAVGGLSYGVATTLNMALLMDSLPDGSNRARAMAFYAATMSGGFAVGNFLGGWLADTFGYDWTFRIAAFPPLLAALFTPYLAKAFGSNRSHSGNSRARARVWVAMSQVRNGRILAIALLAFSLNAVHFLMSTFFPIFAVGIGMSLTSIGLLRGLHSIFGMVTRPLSGEATRFVSSTMLSNIGLVLVVLLIALIPSFDSMLAFVPLFVLLGTARGVVMVSNTVTLVEEVGDDAERRGIAAGIFNTAKDLGNISGPALGGLIAAWIGIEGLLRLGPLIPLALYLIALFFATRTGRKVASREVRDENAG